MNRILQTWYVSHSEYWTYWWCMMYLLFRHYSFHDFHSPPLDDTDFDSLPLVLVIGVHYHNSIGVGYRCLPTLPPYNIILPFLVTGQYSTGKSSMIRYLIRQVNILPHCHLKTSNHPSGLSRHASWTRADNRQVLWLPLLIFFDTQVSLEPTPGQ